jgi:hypothetical protein
MEQNAIYSQAQNNAAVTRVAEAVAELERIVQALKNTGARNGKPGEMTVLDYAEQQLATAIGIRNFLAEVGNRTKL